MNAIKWCSVVISIGVGEGGINKVVDIGLSGDEVQLLGGFLCVVL